MQKTQTEQGKPTMASLGQELKHAREQRGMALQEISNITHIGVRFLQSIENDDYKTLPGGMFNRAFVRKFANRVGYDEDQAVKLYDDQLAASGGAPQRNFQLGIEDFEGKQSFGNGILLSLLALILLAAGAFAAYIYFKPAITEPKPNQSIYLPAPLPTAEPVGTPAASAAADASLIHTPTPEPLVSGALRVQLVASDACWVSVTTDQTDARRILLNAGDIREFTVNEEITFNSVGNLLAMRMIINGHRVNYTKLLPNQKGVVAKNVVITKDNYQQFLD